MIRSARWLSVVLPTIVLVTTASCCFAALLAHPSWLIADAERPSIDHANLADTRPPGNDLTFLFLPHHLSIIRSLETYGHLPMWDARGFAGRPMVGNPQAGLFYPPVWLVWWSRSPAALGWLTFAHLIWAGLGCYVLLRSMNASRWAATISAGVYQASPLLLAHTFEGHYPHVWAVCWYPWAFWAYRYWNHREGYRGLVILPATLALTFLTGHPQEWLFLVLALASCETATIVAIMFRQGPRAVLRRVSMAAAMLTLAVGLSAVDLLPQLSVRSWLLGNHGRAHPATTAEHYHLRPLNLVQLLSPVALGGPADYLGEDNYWETVFSIGLAPLALALVVTLSGRHRQRAGAWLWLLAFALWFSVGRALGLSTLCRAIVPGMDALRVPSRALFLANLAGAVIAGLGADALCELTTDRSAMRRLARRFVLLTALIAISLIAWRQSARDSVHPADLSRSDSVSPALPRNTAPASRHAALSREHVDNVLTRIAKESPFLVSTGALFAIGMILRNDRFRRHHQVAARLLGAVALLELAWYGNHLIHATPPSAFLSSSPIQLALSEMDKSGENGRYPPLRIKARDTFYSDLVATCDGVEKINVYDTFQIDHAAKLYEVLYPIASRPRPMLEKLITPVARENWRRIRRAVLSRMSVGSIVSDRFEIDPGWPIMREGQWNGRPYVVQRNPSTMPRAYVVPNALMMTDQASLVLTSLPDIDPRRWVIMNKDPLAPFPTLPRQPFTTAEWLSTDPDRPALRVKTSSPGLLVLTDTWTPGWTATLDGVTAPVLRGNLAQRVIALPSGGDHVITMSYQPPGLTAGLALTALSFTVWIGVCAAAFHAKRGSRPIASRSFELEQIRRSRVEIAAKPPYRLKLTRVDHAAAIEQTIVDLDQNHLADHQIGGPGPRPVRLDRPNTALEMRWRGGNARRTDFD